MKKQDNEQLCALAQKGDTEARDLLLKNNLGFIRKTANEIYLKSKAVPLSQAFAVLSDMMDDENNTTNKKFDA